MAFIRKVKTASGATAVQIAHKQRGKVVKILQVGSAHPQEDLDILVALAQKRLHENQLSLFLNCNHPCEWVSNDPFLAYCGTFCENRIESWGLIG